MLSNSGEIQLKQIWLSLKPYCRWLILGGTVFFVAKAWHQHWQEVAAINLRATEWAILGSALGVTLTAHVWAGWVWTEILRELNQPISQIWLIQVYLKTNIAKYLPGNVWHYYGRVTAAKTAGVTLGAATLSVLLEPLLMAAAALITAIIALLPVSANGPMVTQELPILGLAIVLLGVHPVFLNRAIRWLGRLKAKAKGSAVTPGSWGLVRYPLLPLLGELGFLVLRNAGFLLIMLSLQPLEIAQLPLLVRAFSLAWLLGMVTPGIPGGLGVFEATAIALLTHYFSSGIVLSAVALYRLISILAEVIGAGLAYLRR